MTVPLGPEQPGLGLKNDLIVCPEVTAVTLTFAAAGHLRFVP